MAAAVLAASLLTAPVVHATEVAGVSVEERAQAGNTELVLNGAGVRTRLFFKVYVAALYAPKKSKVAATLIDSREPRRIVLHLLRDLDADTLFGALQEGLRKNLGEAELVRLKPDTDQFEQLMRGIGNARKGDIITIDFTDTTNVGFNGQARGSVGGADFARALLKVWLGEQPVDAALKQALLGG
jgi:long-chain acyl-CoA synthetase